MLQDEDFKRELFSRVETFFGETGFANVASCHIVVVGVGGVGSHAVNMLVRSGVGSVRLIDFDCVTLSSLNRHAVATLSDVGIPKTVATSRALKRVVPWAQIECITEMFRGENAERLISEGGPRNPDFVLDCIDDVNTKAELISYCLQKKLKIITSMGAGGKSDPTKLRIGSLSDCVKDPLASKIKWKLKKLNVDNYESVTTIYSCEKPICNLLELDDEQAAAPQDYGTADYLRVRVMPVLGTSPSIFGQSIASFVLCAVSKVIMYEPDSCERMSKKLREKLHKSIIKSEKKRFNTPQGDVNLDDDDLEFIVHTIWKSRCAVNGKRFGGHDSLVLTRWDPTLEPTCTNLVLVSQSGLSILEDKGIQGLPSQVQAEITNRLKWARSFMNLCDRADRLDSNVTLTVDGFKRSRSSGHSTDNRKIEGKPIDKKVNLISKVAGGFGKEIFELWKSHTVALVGTLALGVSVGMVIMRSAKYK